MSQCCPCNSPVALPNGNAVLGQQICQQHGRLGVMHLMLHLQQHQHVLRAHTPSGIAPCARRCLIQRLVLTPSQSWALVQCGPSVVHP